MKPPGTRLIALTPAELVKLREKADDLARMQDFLNRLPMGLQVENLSDEELDRLRELMTTPAALISGSRFLSWHNMSRKTKLSKQI